MSKALIISGHPYLSYSNCNKAAIEKYKKGLENV